MEMSQGNSLCSYHKLKKCHFSFLLQNRRTEKNRSCLRVWYQWEEEGVGERVWKGEYSANTV
jgi:hypothetical protein